jgi:hypothetical protein
MHKPTSIFLLISGLLLASCNTELPPANDKMVELSAGKRKRIEAKDKKQETSYKKGRTDNSSSVSIAGNTTENSLQELTKTEGIILQSIGLPDELMLQVFSELSVKDIAHAMGVCRHWQKLSEEPALWRAVRLRIHGDYSASEATKEQAKKHMLRVQVNTLTDVTTIIHLVDKYKLNGDHPFKIYQDLLINRSDRPNLEMLRAYAVQGNEEAIKIKIEGLVNGRLGYKQNPEEAVAFNDSLVEQDNEEAINRKIEGLNLGRYGYKVNPVAAAAILNDFLVEQGNERAIGRKIQGLEQGQYGYERNYEAAVALIESLITQGNQQAVIWKIYGLSLGRYGYKVNPVAAAILNDFLVGQGNERAIRQKIEGLTNGRYGYRKNLKDAAIFNDFLVEKGNEEAINRKIAGLVNGGWGYKQNPEEAVAFNDSLVEQSNKTAMHRKIEGLTNGRCGYRKDLKTAAILNDFLVEQGDEKAIEQKITGLARGQYGYERNYGAAVGFNETLVAQGNEKAIIWKFNRLAGSYVQLKGWLEEAADKGKRWACYLKAQGLKYGILGFEKDREAAIEYILANDIPY